MYSKTVATMTPDLKTALTILQKKSEAEQKDAEACLQSGNFAGFQADLTQHEKEKQAFYDNVESYLQEKNLLPAGFTREDDAWVISLEGTNADQIVVRDAEAWEARGDDDRQVVNG